MKLSRENKRVLVNMSIVGAAMLIPFIIIARTALGGNYLFTLQDKKPATAACIESVSSPPAEPTEAAHRFCRSLEKYFRLWQEHNKREPAQFTDFLNKTADRMLTAEQQPEKD